MTHDYCKNCKNSAIQEMDINVGSSASGTQPQIPVSRISTDEPQKDFQQTYETLWMRLLSAVKTRNTQDQIRVLESLYLSELENRRRIHVRKISRTRLLRQAQNFLAVRGLVLGKGVLTAYRRTSRCSSSAMLF